jgi:antitoxin VapB
MAKPKRSDRGQKSVRELRAKVFRTGRSQAVRLPKEVRFDEDQSELRVRREGNRVILEPLDEWPEPFLAALGSCQDFPEPPRRTRLREARDRFGR